MIDQFKDLKIVTSNLNWTRGQSKCRGKCKQKMEQGQNLKYEQCPRCAVCVSQTKIGVALQFEWGPEGIYTSVDIIPEFFIQVIHSEQYYLLI